MTFDDFVNALKSAPDNETLETLKKEHWDDIFAEKNRILSVLDHFNEEDFHKKVSLKPYPDKTVLEVIRQLDDNELLLQILCKFPDLITASDLQLEFQEGPHQGQTILLRFALEARDEKPDNFIKIWAKHQASITLEHLRKKIKAGEQKGRSALILLAAGASTGTLDPFLKVWEAYQDDFTLEDLLSMPEEGEYQGKSFLWFLADLASNKKPDFFLKMFEKYQNEIPLEFLTSSPEKGGSKGISILWYLACASFNKINAPFMTVWKKHQDNITLPMLRTSPQMGISKDQNILYVLAEAMKLHNTEAFEAIWAKHQDGITLNDLLFAPKEGSYAGISLLCLFAVAAYMGYPKYFLKVWQKYQKRISIDELRRQVQQEFLKGCSIIYLLAGGCEFKPELFTEVLAVRGSEIELDDLLKEAEQGEDKGLNALWWLAFAAYKKKQEHFLNIFKKYQKEITVNHLRIKPNKGDHKNKSLLWLLAFTIWSDENLSFDLWEQYQDSLAVDDLCLKPTEGEHANISILYILALAAVDGRFKPLLKVFEKNQFDIPLEELRLKISVKNVQANILMILAWASRFNEDLFLKVFNRYHADITLDDLLEKAEGDPHNGKTVLAFLVDSPHLFIHVILNTPFIIPHSELITFFPILASNHVDMELLQESITKKIKFYTALNGDIEGDLFALAKAVTAVGCFRAYYDLGKYYLRKNDQEKALEAFRLVANESHFYAVVQSEAAEHAFGLFVDNKGTVNEDKYLRFAVEFALKTSDEEREHFLQRLAKTYVKGIKAKVEGEEEIPLLKPFMIEAMNDTTPVKNCIAQFVEIKKEYDNQKEIEELKEKINTLKEELKQQSSVVGSQQATIMMQQQAITYLLQKETPELSDPQTLIFSAQPRVTGNAEEKVAPRSPGCTR